MKKSLNLRELAAATNVPERTIRYYISKGLLPPPVLRGRKASYSDEHREIISKIKKMQSKGHTLTEIATYLALSPKKGNLILEGIKGKSKRSSLKGEFATSNMAADSLINKVSTWYVYKIGEDIAVHIRSGVSAWRIRKIINLIKNIKEE